MGAREYSLEPEFGGQEMGDEAEETLSLCDLVISSDENEYWNEHFSKEEQRSFSGHDFFEFSSDSFTSSASSFPRDSIVFCGKRIPCKEAASQENSESQQTVSSNHQKVRKSFSFPWKSRKTSSSSSFSSSSSKPHGIKKKCNKDLSLSVSGNYGSSTMKCRDKFDLSVKKVSILATPVKSRWYLFAFGVGRFPMEMELKEMKMRQSRRAPATMFPADEVKMVKSSKGSGKGFWGLLRYFGCNTVENKAMVKASLGCFHPWEVGSPVTGGNKLH